MSYLSCRRLSAIVLLLSLGVAGTACRKTPQPVPATDAGPEDAGITEDAGPPDAGPPGIGSSCASDSDCGSGHCDLQTSGGYCIDACTVNSDCPEGSSCQQIGRGTAYCLALCESGTECRADYACQSIAASCVPEMGCTMDNDCPEGSICNENSGFCTGAIGARYHVGSTCTGDNQCVVGPYPFCISPDMHFTDGYCSSVCSNDGQCGSKAVCVPELVTGQNYKVCMQSCASDSDCRDKYYCLDRKDQKFCIAWCVENSDCIDSGDTCDTSTGRCLPPPDAGQPDAGPMEVDAGEPMDAGEPVDAGVFIYDGGYPAPFPAPPQVVWSSGPVLRSPEFIPIFFANDVPEQVAQIEDFDSRVGSSAYWTAVTSEYGVGPASVAPSIHVDEISTGTITDSNIQSWLREHIKAGLLPQPDANTLYLMHYPWSMSIVLQGSRSCRGFGGYHSNFKLQDGRQVVYAVMPRCGEPMGEDTVATETMAESHEMVEAVTDPQPFAIPGYGTVDNGHYVWAQVIGGGEVADMCQQDSASYVHSEEVGHAVQRSWSNQAALAGHDPCVPALAGEPYFNAVPELPDTLPVFVGSGFVDTTSVHVPSGGSRTITLFLFSDTDTGGPWDVRILDYGAMGGGNSPFTYSLDRSRGQNGDQLKLTIKSASTAARTGIFGVRSTLNGRSHSWIGLADQ